MKRREHDVGCPKLQYWDAGEWDCPCTCFRPRIKRRKETERALDIEEIRSKLLENAMNRQGKKEV